LGKEKKVLCTIDKIPSPVLIGDSGRELERARRG
jgi:hypothetical protein